MHRSSPAMLYAVAFVLVFCACSDAPTPKVLVIGLDGIHVGVLATTSTPNIDSLAAAGAFSDAAQTLVRTVSGPGWSSMLIGARSDKHLVTSNELTGHNYAEYPDFLTRLERINPAYNTFAVLDWPPLATTASGGPIISDAVDVKLFFDGSVDGYGWADSTSVAAAVEHLLNEDPDAAFVYIGAVDEVAHATSTHGPEYRAALELADAYVGALAAAVRRRPTYIDEDWLILISTDHGRDERGGHGGDSPGERTIFYLASGPSTVQGKITETPYIVDVAVTALTHLGIEIDPEWDLDGKAVGLRR
ncbi:MAG: alkaline phosphatase family protein [Gemmatimonadetes bacterium]|nr:alkaline phosphatase family protein [Gemmatimonadota bacterium]